MSKENENNNVEKVIPSVIERCVDKIVVTVFKGIVPKNMSPNAITLIGAIGGFMGAGFAVLARIHPLFLIGTCCGILTHLICDSLDGHIARSRNLKSNRGAFFDLLTDILHITYLLIGLTFGGVMHWYVTIFLVPVYAIIIFTSMNEIHYLKKFSFPSVGPSETHLLLLAVMIGSMITSCKVLFTIKGIEVKFGDIVCLLGGIPMYFEMIRLQISVYLRIRKQDKSEE